MKRFYTDGDIPPLKVVLTEYMNVGEIKKLVALTGLPIPTRKAELVDLIVRYLDGDGLHTAWQALDELQRAAVAEIVHGSVPSRAVADSVCLGSWRAVSTSAAEDPLPTDYRLF